MIITIAGRLANIPGPDIAPSWNIDQSLVLPFAGIIQIRFGGCFSPAPRAVSRIAGPLAFAALLRQRRF